MKKILFLIVFVLSVSVTYGQDIADVSQTEQSYIVRDANSNHISSRPRSSDELCGFSSTLIVVQSQQYFYVYDQKFNLISSRQKNSDEKFKNVSGNYIIIKSGQYTITYDKDFKHVSSRQD